MSILEGKTICFTGTLSTQTRAQATAVANELGAKVTKSVSGKTDILVAGGETGTKKLQDAASKGVEVWTEEQFNSAIQDNGNDTEPPVEEGPPKKKKKKRKIAGNAQKKAPKPKEEPKEAEDEEAAAAGASTLEGKTICFAGKFATRTQAHAAEVAREFGAKVSTSVSAKTDILVSGKGGAAKIKQAKAKGVEIWTEEKFNVVIGDEDKKEEEKNDHVQMNLFERFFIDDWDSRHWYCYWNGDYLPREESDYVFDPCLERKIVAGLGGKDEEKLVLVVSPNAMPVTSKLSSSTDAASDSTAEYIRTLQAMMDSFDNLSSAYLGSESDNEDWCPFAIAWNSGNEDEDMGHNVDGTLTPQALATKLGAHPKLVESIRSLDLLSQYYEEIEDDDLCDDDYEFTKALNEEILNKRNGIAFHMGEDLMNPYPVFCVTYDVNEKVVFGFISALVAT